MTNLSRRGFLGAIIAAGVAPLIVSSGVLMPIKPRLVIAPSVGGIDRTVWSWWRNGENLSDVSFQGIKLHLDAAFSAPAPDLMLVSDQFVKLLECA